MSTTDPRDLAELDELLDEVRRIEAESHTLVTGVLAGGYSSMFRGSGIEFHEIREYVEGDDPRAVDWNVTARLGRPFVKDFVEERDRTLLLVVDLSHSMDGGFGAWSARQLGARLCACLALAADQSEDKVGLIGFRDEVVHFVPPRKGIRHTLRILRDILSLRGDSSATRAETALAFASKVLHRRTTVFLVSDFLESCPATELAACSRRHDLVAVRLSMPEALELPRALVRLRDPESGRVVLVDGRDAGVRNEWHTRGVEWRAHCDEIFHRATMDVIDVEIPRERDPDAVARPILGFYRMRARRMAHR